MTTEEDQLAEFSLPDEALAAGEHRQAVALIDYMKYLWKHAGKVREAYRKDPQGRLALYADALTGAKNWMVKNHKWATEADYAARLKSTRDVCDPILKGLGVLPWTPPADQ